MLYKISKNLLIFASLLEILNIILFSFYNYEEIENKSYLIAGGVNIIYLALFILLLYNKQEAFVGGNTQDTKTNRSIFLYVSLLIILKLIIFVFNKKYYLDKTNLLSLIEFYREYPFQIYFERLHILIYIPLTLFFYGLYNDKIKSAILSKLLIILFSFEFIANLVFEFTDNSQISEYYFLSRLTYSFFNMSIILWFITIVFYKESGAKNILINKNTLSSMEENSGLTICSKDFFKKLDKLKNLLKENIYTENEYLNKKNDLISELEQRGTDVPTEDFLEQLIPYKKEGAITYEDISLIKEHLESYSYSDNQNDYSKNAPKQKKYQYVDIRSINMFHNSFSFSGRIKRAEYIISIIIFYLIIFCFSFIINALESTRDTTIKGVGVTLLLICYFMLFWFLLAQGAKRSHDIGNSGYFILIPLYGVILFFINSERGRNKYGDNPKGII